MEGEQGLKQLIGDTLLKVNGENVDSVKFDTFYSEF